MFVTLLVSTFYVLFHYLFIFIFSFQRMDLGECPKIHDLALRADYEIASKKRDYCFELDVRRRITTSIALKDMCCYSKCTTNLAFLLNCCCLFSSHKNMNTLTFSCIDGLEYWELSCPVRGSRITIEYMP